MMKALFLALVLVAVALADPSKTIMENIAEHPQLVELNRLLSLPAYRPLYDLLHAPGAITAFAPNNAAFIAANIPVDDTVLVTESIKYHILPTPVKTTDLHEDFNVLTTSMLNPNFVNVGAGKAQSLIAIKTPRNVQLHWTVFARLASANIVTSDIPCSNGILQVIDRVMALPFDAITTASLGNLNELSAAVVKAGLVDFLNDTAAITVFAPTNDAFSRIPDWVNLPVSQLTALLQYHIVPSVVFTTAVTPSGTKVTTLDGGKQLTLHARGAYVEISDSNNKPIAITRDPNVLMTNGVVHIIDRVLVPPALAAELGMKF